MNYSQFRQFAESNAAIGAGLGALAGGTVGIGIGKMLHGNDYDLKKGLAYGLGGAALGGGAGYVLGNRKDAEDDAKVQNTRLNWSGGLGITGALLGAAVGGAANAVRWQLKNNEPTRIPIKPTLKGAGIGALATLILGAGLGQLVPRSYALN